MSVSESILVAIFCMGVVFVVFGMLWVFMRIFSLVIQTIEKSSK